MARFYLYDDAQPAIARSSLRERLALKTEGDEERVSSAEAQNSKEALGAVVAQGGTKEVNRHTPESKFLATHSKQTAATRSNRHKFEPSTFASVRPCRCGLTLSPRFLSSVSLWLRGFSLPPRLLVSRPPTFYRSHAGGRNRRISMKTLTVIFSTRHTNAHVRTPRLLLAPKNNREQIRRKSCRVVEQRRPSATEARGWGRTPQVNSLCKSENNESCNDERQDDCQKPPNVRRNSAGRNFLLPPG